MSAYGRWQRLSAIFCVGAGSWRKLNQVLEDRPSRFLSNSQSTDFRCKSLFDLDMNLEIYRLSWNTGLLFITIFGLFGPLNFRSHYLLYLRCSKTTPKIFRPKIVEPKIRSLKFFQLGFSMLGSEIFRFCGLYPLLKQFETTP